MAARIRLSATALALTILSAIGPLCVPAMARLAVAPSASIEEADCCPAGSHPAGECPLHRRTAGRPAQDGGPRLTCGCHQSAAMLAPAGPVERAPDPIAPIAIRRPAVLAADATAETSTIPPSPPPRT